MGVKVLFSFWAACKHKYIYAIFTSYGIRYSEVVTAHIIDLMQFITNNHIKAHQSFMVCLLGMGKLQKFTDALIKLQSYSIAYLRELHTELFSITILQ